MESSTQNNRAKIITIDGPAGAGKSTVAKIIAKTLNITYLDTGAMYRALTLKALWQGLDLKNEDKLVDLAKNTQITFKRENNVDHVILDGKDVSDDIRTVDVTNNVSITSSLPRIREIMVAWQRDIGHDVDIVVEGRDVGTVVFPDAKNKFYLDADINERTKRRAKDFAEKDQKVDNDQLKADMMKRDANDMNRDVGALKKAEDAIVINSTGNTAEETAQEILSLIK